MVAARRLSLPAVAFFIGLGSTTVLAQTTMASGMSADPTWNAPATSTDTLDSAAIDRIVDRDLNDGQVQNLQSGDLLAAERDRLERGEAEMARSQDSAQLSAQAAARQTEIARLPGLENNRLAMSASASSLEEPNDGTPRDDGQQAYILQGISHGSVVNNETDNQESLRHHSMPMTDSSGSLTALGQTLRSNETSLRQAHRTEQGDLRQVRVDESGGNSAGAQQEQQAAVEEQTVLHTDRQTVENDIVAVRAAAQPQDQAVEQDRAALDADLQQTRADREDGNAAALQQDLANDQTSRQNLRTATAVLQQNLAQDGLGNRRKFANGESGSSGSQNLSGANGGENRFAFNQVEETGVTGVVRSSANVNVPAAAAPSTGMRHPAGIIHAIHAGHR